MPQYALGIDPGDRYIGLALVRIDVDDKAYPVYLGVVDLGQGKSSYRSLLASRSSHRRGRRTRKSSDARIRHIEEILTRENIPKSQADAVIALCRHRGWKADNTDGYTDSPTEAEADSLRIPRGIVLSALGELIPKAAPQLDQSAINEILTVLDARSDAHGLDNSRVGCCVAESCRKNRCMGADYPNLWLLQGMLSALLPKPLLPAREYLLQRLRVEGIDVRAGLEAFKCKERSHKREKHLKCVQEAWLETKHHYDIPDPVKASLDRFLSDARKQVSAPDTATRLRMCPDHLLERVQTLAQGENPSPGGANEASHSLVWEAVAAKLGSYLAYQLQQLLPEGSVVSHITVERAAFDLIHLKSTSSSRFSLKDMDQARWLGPYGQLGKLLSEQTDGQLNRNALLAIEVGGLCSLCGLPLNGAIDSAHLIQREKVGGYPYIAIAAAHPACNANMGKSRATVHPAAVEAMRQTRFRLMQKNGFVHAWFDAKLGIMNALASQSNRSLPVDQFLLQAFASRESTMQGADRIGEAARKAVGIAGFGNPVVKKRGAAEVAGARWVAIGGDDYEEAPWFDKDLDKQEGGILNHAIDAFIVAALPPAQPIRCKGETKWVVAPERIYERLAILQSETYWRQACDSAWDKHARDTKGNIAALDITSITLRRVWRQAYARDTRVRDNYETSGKSAYRIGAQGWLTTLKAKITDDPKKARTQIENLQFTPLRERVLSAFDRTKDQPGMCYDTLRREVIDYLKTSTLSGLASTQHAYTAGHPVREDRIELLRSWAETIDYLAEIPPWIGMSIKKDLTIGAHERILPIRQGGLNLESWAMHMWLLAVHREQWASVFDIKPDGGLSFVAGQRCKIDFDCLKEILPISNVTPLAPSVPAWRRKAGDLLRAAGFVKAWVIGRGSIIDTTDGFQLLLKDKKSLKSAATSKKLAGATTVIRGGVAILSQ